MEEIQSAKNPRVKEWKKLLSKKGRDQSGLYLIEGFHLVEEAFKTDEIVELMVERDIPMPLFPSSDEIPVTLISKEISHSISGTETPQGIFAVCKKRSNVIDLTVHKKLLLLDGVQDPGNIGTMVRTADAAGIDAVIFGKGTGDLYNPKVIRSAQGSHFHLQVDTGDLSEWIEKLKAQNIPVYGTAIENANPYMDVSSSAAFALIMGNEGAGVNEAILQKTDQNLYIPLYGQSESLNVAVAAGILLYHLRKPI